MILQVKKISFWTLLGFLSFALNGTAQVYTAKLVDAANKTPIAYANIGILESTVGTNSDEDGKFTLTIPAELENKTLSVFLIGYEKSEMPVTEFISRAKSNKHIELYKSENTLSEIVVKPSKLRQAVLGNDIKCEGKDGVPIPFVLEEKKKKSGTIKREADTLTEIGTLMKVKKRKTFIDSISINVGTCTYEEILYRVNIYEIKDDVPQIILKEPIYIRKKRAEVGNELKLDLSDKNLVVNNNFVVSIERVKDLGKGVFAICGSFAGAPTYMRIASLQNTFIKIPLISFGISAYVTFSEEIKD